MIEPSVLPVESGSVSNSNGVNSNIRTVITAAMLITFQTPTE